MWADSLSTYTGMSFHHNAVIIFSIDLWWQNEDSAHVFREFTLIYTLEVVLNTRNHFIRLQYIFFLAETPDRKNWARAKNSFLFDKNQHFGIDCHFGHMSGHAWKCKQYWNTDEEEISTHLSWSSHIGQFWLQRMKEDIFYFFFGLETSAKPDKEQNWIGSNRPNDDSNVFRTTYQHGGISN